MNHHDPKLVEDMQKLAAELHARAPELRGPFALDLAEPASTRLLIDGRAMVGGRKTGTKTQWTTREVALLRAHFPAGGLKECLPLLPGRSAGAIYQKAALLGLRKPNRRGTVTERQSYKTTPQIDAAIVHLYAKGKPTSDAIGRLCGALARPRNWLNRRALALGLTVPRFREGPWSDREVEIVREAGAMHPDTIRLRLKREGFRRTSAAIMQKRNELRVLREIGDSGRYTATALGEIFGVSRGVVHSWVERGWLAGTRLKSHSVPVHRDPHDHAWWQFTRKEVRQFVVENVGMIDFHKVDKFWLVDLLAGGPGEFN